MTLPAANSTMATRKQLRRALRSVIALLESHCRPCGDGVNLLGRNSASAAEHTVIRENRRAPHRET